MAFGYSEEYLRNLQGIALGLSTGVSQIVPGSMRAALTAGGLTSVSTWKDLVLNELPIGINGYDRVPLVKSDGQQLTALSDITYLGDPDNRLTVPRLDAIFTATGGDLIWTSCGIGINLPTKGSYGISDVSTSTGQLTISGTIAAGDIQVNDQVYLASPLNYQLPTGFLLSANLMYVKEISGNLVKLSYSLGGTVVIPTDKGSLPITPYSLKLTKGLLVAGYDNPDYSYIYDGSPHEIRWNLSMFNSAIASGRDW